MFNLIGQIARAPVQKISVLAILAIRKIFEVKNPILKF